MVLRPRQRKLEGLSRAQLRDVSGGWCYCGVIMGVYWDNGKQPGNYNLELRAKCLGLRAFLASFILEGSNKQWRASQAMIVCQQ